jgi:hypothetical protein
VTVTAVVSTTLTTVGYDPARALLQLEFRSGLVYEFFEVPAVVFAALLRARSKGKYFNEWIRGRFRYALAAGARAGQA